MFVASNLNTFTNGYLVLECIDIRISKGTKKTLNSTEIVHSRWLLSLAAKSNGLPTLTEK